MRFKPSVFLVKGIPRYGPTVSWCRLSKAKVPAEQVICHPNWLYSSWFPALNASPSLPSLSALNQSSTRGLGICVGGAVVRQRAG